MESRPELFIPRWNKNNKKRKRKVESRRLRKENRSKWKKGDSFC